MDISPTERHLDRLIDESSIKVIEEMHEQPEPGKNYDVGQIKWPILDTFSHLKPMIEANKDTVIEPIKPDKFQLGELKLNEFQLELFSLLRSYKDLLYTDECYENLDDILQVYALHALEHLKNARSKIISNNKAFERRSNDEAVLLDEPKLRDQGFTRAKILFLVPFRHSALRIGKCLANILHGSHDISNLNKFVEEFGDDNGDPTLRPVATAGEKPIDFQRTFHGNTDDSFRVGLKLTKKSLRFFSEFYQSDIIMASPLGLKTLDSPDGYDFLSSIEIVIIDQAEIMLMQNWEHLVDLMLQINRMPSKPREMDVARVRPWFLENWSKYYRQLVMFSSITVPLLHSFFQTNSLNYEGYLAFKQKVTSPQAKQITSKCTQHFLFYDSQSSKEVCDSRFNFFTRNVLPKYTKSNGESLGHTLILVSSYFDFVRLRNYFRREKLSFTQICEYTEDNKVSKARQLFYFGARQFLLYTERCHFYHRYKIKGIRNVVFYEPPTFANFYTELLSMLVPELQGKKFDEGSTEFTATTLFSNYDTLQLGAIIGFSSASRLIQNKKSIT